MRIAPSVTISDQERDQLSAWSRGRSTQHRLVLRSKIILRAADGLQNKEIVDELHVRPETVALWRNRFVALRLEGIEKDAPRPGRKPRISQKLIDAIIDRTLHTKPHGATHWTTRTLAREMKVSNFTIQKIWKAHRIQPHRERSFKLSRDTRFNEKVRDVVGLYMDPPDKAIVVCMDEKSGIQALDRSQTILPVRPGMPASMSYDYKRNGRIDLFAALNILDGTVITEFHERHRHQEFLIFLRTMDGCIPEELDIHMVLDNYGTHTQPDVKRWFERHPRFKLHFTPKGASWINMVEAWLSILTKKQIRRNSFGNTNDVIRAVNEFVETYQENPRPFIWKVRADEIIRKVARLRDLQASNSQRR
jgi:transposase